MWAYVVSLRVVAGESIATRPQLLEEVNNLREQHPSFNHDLALRQLKRVGVIDPELIAEVASRLKQQDEEEECEEDDEQDEAEHGM